MCFGFTIVINWIRRAADRRRTEGPVRQRREYFRTLLNNAEVEKYAWIKEEISLRHLYLCPRFVSEHYLLGLQLSLCVDIQFSAQTAIMLPDGEDIQSHKARIFLL